MTLPFKVAVVLVTPFQQNCTLIWDEGSRRAAVIDPGGDVPRILAALDEMRLRPEKILLTHGHIDHAGGAAELRETLLARRQASGEHGATLPIVGPNEADRFLLDNLAAQGREYSMNSRSVLPDLWLREGDTVDLAGHVFDVLHCPGHTPGHLVFVQVESRFALVGDVLFRNSVGRTDFPYGDGEALLRGIRDKLLPLGDDIAFVCGHGPGSTIGTERRSNPFLR